MTVYLQDPDVTILQGDALELLRGLPAGSVHMACTSPPFYGLRDYGTGDQQIGLEATPDEWVERLVGVFRELRRVLRDDGSLWLEIGDSYASGEVGRHDTASKTRMGPEPRPHASGKGLGQPRQQSPRPPGTKPKDLIGAPWLLAFALRADGWYLRSEIIWAKPNPMPESVSDRPTVSHSRVFLLTKRPRYFYDAEAIREAYEPDERAVTTVQSGNGAIGLRGIGERERWAHSGRNRRSVWSIPTQPYPEAHFATWPEKLVEPMILAGTSERGVCPVCGAPWERITETRQALAADGKTCTRCGKNHGRARADSEHRAALMVEQFCCNETTTTGWQPTCECGTEQGVIGQPGTVAHEPVPATILDPFGGAGTSAVVARKLGRRAILLELNPEYCALAARRLAQQSLFANA